MTITVSRVRLLALSCLILAIGIIMTIDAKNSIAAAYAAIETCLRIMIPSLFSFMCLSGFLLSSGAYKVIFRLPYLLLRRVIRLSESEFSILCLSLIGGYPVGAKLLAESQTTRNSGMIRYCYCGSPLFLAGITGTGLFGDVFVGIKIWAACALANLVIAVILNIKNTPAKERIQLAEVSPLDCFISAVTSSAKAMLTVCAMIIVFAVLISEAKFLGLTGGLSEFILPLIEISNLSKIPKGGYSLIPYIAAVSSFGGLCIVSQAAAIMKGMNTAKFLLVRIPAAIISSALAILFI